MGILEERGVRFARKHKGRERRGQISYQSGVASVNRKTRRGGRNWGAGGVSGK